MIQRIRRLAHHAVVALRLQRLPELGRLFADLLAVKLGRPEFTWGRLTMTMTTPGLAREAYLQALRAADHREIRELLEFSRS